MCDIYKCDDKVQLERYVQGWKPLLVYVDHKDVAINYLSYNGPFPCYLLCDFDYPACGPDSVSVSIISRFEDLEAYSV